MREVLREPEGVMLKIFFGGVAAMALAVVFETFGAHDAAYALVCLGLIGILVGTPAALLLIVKLLR